LYIGIALAFIVSCGRFHIRGDKDEEKGGSVMKDCRNVVIAVNGSKDVLVDGLKLLRDEKCHITVVKVLPSYEGDLSMVGVKNIDELLNSGADKEISAIMEIAKTVGAKVKVRLEEGEIDEKIVAVAEEEKADLIIMGAGSKNNIKKFFLGSVLDEVTHQAACPVLVVNDQGSSHCGFLYNFCGIAT
jgi:nucleotide-binding universal stress UspA family protein